MPTCAHTCPVIEAATTWDAYATRARPPSNLVPFKNVSAGNYKSCDDCAIPSLPLAWDPPNAWASDVFAVRVKTSHVLIKALCPSWCLAFLVGAILLAVFLVLSLFGKRGRISALEEENDRLGEEIEKLKRKESNGKDDQLFSMM